MAAEDRQTMGAHYLDADEWLWAIRNHSCNNRQIEPYDNPARELVGYRCFGCGEVFFIKKEDFKQTERQIFENYLMIPANRRELTRILHHDLDLPDVPLPPSRSP